MSLQTLRLASQVVHRSLGLRPQTCNPSVSPFTHKFSGCSSSRYDMRQASPSIDAVSCTMPASPVSSWPQGLTRHEALETALQLPGPSTGNRPGQSRNRPLTWRELVQCLVWAGVLVVCTLPDAARLKQCRRCGTVASLQLVLPRAGDL